MPAVAKKPPTKKGETRSETVVIVNGIFEIRAVRKLNKEQKQTFKDIVQMSERLTAKTLAEHTDWFKATKATMTPGTYLRVYRDNRELTQKALADKLGIPPQHVSNMETGDRSISKEMAKRLSDILSAPIERFL